MCEKAHCHSGKERMIQKEKRRERDTEIEGMREGYRKRGEESDALSTLA